MSVLDQDYTNIYDQKAKGMQISRMHGSMQVSGMHGTHLMPFLSASELSARFCTVQNSANFYDEGAQCKGIYSAHILQGA